MLLSFCRNIVQVLLPQQYEKKQWVNFEQSVFSLDTTSSMQNSLFQRLSSPTFKIISTWSSMAPNQNRDGATHRGQEEMTSPKSQQSQSRRSS